MQHHNITTTSLQCSVSLQAHYNTIPTYNFTTIQLPHTISNLTIAPQQQHCIPTTVCMVNIVSHQPYYSLTTMSLQYVASLQYHYICPYNQQPHNIPTTTIVNSHYNFQHHYSPMSVSLQSGYKPPTYTTPLQLHYIIHKISNNNIASLQPPYITNNLY